MKYRNTIIALGFVILVFSTSFVGIFKFWKESVIILSALAIVILAYLAGKERRDSTKIEPKIEPKIES
jgi:Ca2+/H+ antiporter